MLESPKIVIDLGSVRLDLSFESEAPPQPMPTMVRSSFVFGLMNYSRQDLEKYKACNEKVKVHVIGGFRLENDVSPALAVAVMASLHVVGKFQAPNAVKTALLQSGKII